MINSMVPDFMMGAELISKSTPFAEVESFHESMDEEQFFASNTFWSRSLLYMRCYFDYLLVSEWK